MDISLGRRWDDVTPTIGQGRSGYKLTDPNQESPVGAVPEFAAMLQLANNYSRMNPHSVRKLNNARRGIQGDSLRMNEVSSASGTRMSAASLLATSSALSSDGPVLTRP